MCISSKIAVLFKPCLSALACVLLISADAQIYSVSEFPQNSKEADFSAIFLGEDVIFCSSRTRKTTNYNMDSVQVFYTDLFISKSDGNGGYLLAEPLKGDVNSFYNEGHSTVSSDGLTMYYTGNLMRKTGKSTKTDEYKLGIFIAQFYNGEWIKTGEFQFNSPNGKFSTAHPFLADGDNTLYFASNRPGGFGGSDIYKCEKTANGWSNPVNLGENVNDEGNEFFPFVNEYGTLYFTSDGRYDSEGMDIYCCYKEDNEFEEAFRLNNTINSAYDELAYFEKRGSNIGLFSSNRNRELDDIFLFTKTDEQSRQCTESKESVLCYRFVDENLQKLEKSMPIVYKWELGDGTYMTGDTILHCYQTPGTYTVVLSAVDTLTKMRFSHISEAKITITDPKSPVIYLPDTVYAGRLFEASVFTDLFDDFEIKEIKWTLNDGNNFEGKNFQYNLISVGNYQLKCEVLGGKIKNGSRNRICIYKNFQCIEAPAAMSMEEPLVEIPKKQPVEVRMNTKRFGNYGINELAISDNFYMLIIAESVNPIGFENELFRHIEGEISEIKTPTGYIYAIERKSNWKDLVSLHTDLKDKGLRTTYAEAFNPLAYEEALVRKGFYEKEPLTAQEIKEEIPSVEKPVTSKEEVIEPIALEESAIKSEEKNTDVPKPLNIKENTIIDEESLDQTALLEPSVKSDEKITSISGSLNTEKKGAIKEDTTVITAQPVAEEQPVVKEEPVAVVAPVYTPKPEVKTKEPVVVKEVVKPVIVADKPTAKPITPAIQEAPAARAENKPVTAKKTITLYHIVIDSAQKRVDFSNDYFKNIDTEIAELKTKSGYKYTILTAPSAHYLENALVELKAHGYANAHIISYDLQEFSNDLIKIGNYSKTINIENLNKEFAKLADIKFDYNSSEILPQSFANLDYIVSIMTLEDGFALKINAHTCNTGNSEYNKKLSDRRAKSVADYLMNKGVPKERLITASYGDSKPAASNFTVDGRSTNRRVEFIIVYDGNK